MKRYFMPAESNKQTRQKYEGIPSIIPVVITRSTAGNKKYLSKSEIILETYLPMRYDRDVS
jgi:hypothetical protein